MENCLVGAFLLLAGWVVNSCFEMAGTYRRVHANLIRALGAARDEAAAQEVFRSEIDRLRSIVACQHEAVIVTDELGRVTLMNPAAEAMLGCSSAQVYLNDVANVIMLEGRRYGQVNEAPNLLSREWTIKDIWKRAVRDGEAVDDMRCSALLPVDGPIRAVAVSAAAVRRAQDGQGGPGHGHSKPAGALYGGVLVLRDVSLDAARMERERRAERFSTVQAMASVVQLVALDDHLVASGLASRESEKWTDPAGSGGASPASFQPRRSKLRAPELFSPHELFVELALFLPRLLGPRTDVVVKPSRKTLRVFADLPGLRDALLQLSLMSRSLVQGYGGRITFSVEHVDDRSQSPRFKFGAPIPGAKVRLDVADSTCQCTSETLLEAFEPYLFTEARNVERAFQLLDVYETIRRNGGMLGVQSRPTSGSVLSIFLPSPE